MPSLSRRDIVKRLSGQHVEEAPPIPHYQFLDNYRVSMQRFPDGRHLVWVKGQSHAMRRLTPLQIAEMIPGAMTHEAFAGYKITEEVPTSCPEAHKVCTTIFSPESMRPCGQQRVFVDANGICTSENDPNAEAPTTFHYTSGCKRRVDE